MRVFCGADPEGGEGGGGVLGCGGGECWGGEFWARGACARECLITALKPRLPVYCFAPAAFDDLLKALGMSAADLLAEKRLLIKAGGCRSHAHHDVDAGTNMQDAARLYRLCKLAHKQAHDSTMATSLPAVG